ncbi:MAG: ABC transporter ATP-binding protein [Bacteroidota bacterium]
MSNQPVVQIQELLFSWKTGGKPILDIQELTINQNERVFIEGHSGCGKSTLLGILGGVNLPQQGHVKVLGQEIHSLSSNRRDHFRADHIGFIFQMFNIIPYLSMVENVILPCQFSSCRLAKAAQKHTLEQEAKRLLNHLGLTDEKLYTQPVTELSMGQQQRVAAARALIGHPEIIIADEPTSSLDANAREAFLNLLFQQCDEEGSTLIFVSHDAGLEQRFERTVRLNDVNKAHLQTELN